MKTASSTWPSGGVLTISLNHHDAVRLSLENAKPSANSVWCCAAVSRLSSKGLLI
jgi:hypothetical protein